MDNAKLREALEKFMRNRGRHDGEHKFCCENGRCFLCEESYVRAEAELNAALAAAAELEQLPSESAPTPAMCKAAPQSSGDALRDELATYKGRLYEFYVMKKERPIDPVYWDEHEERRLKQTIGELEAALASRSSGAGERQSCPVHDRKAWGAEIAARIENGDYQCTCAGRTKEPQG